MTSTPNRSAAILICSDRRTYQVTDSVVRLVASWMTERSSIAHAHLKGVTESPVNTCTLDAMAVEDERDEIRAAFDGHQSMAITIATLRGLSTSRSFDGVTFTIGLGDNDDPEHADALVHEAQTVDPDLRATPTGIGWGGDSGAVSLVLDSLERFGGVGGGAVLAWSGVKFTCRRVVRLWRHFRGDEGVVPDMSVGAVGYLCLADLHDAIGDRFDNVSLVHAGELMPGAGTALGHSGAGELFIYLFADRQASWLYLANSRGRLLHRSESGALPWSFYWPTGTDWNAETSEPPFLAEGFEPDANDHEEA